MTFKKILKTSWLSSASVILAGLYYGTLDIWGDEWGWISNYKNIHGCIYSILMLLTIFFVLCKCILDIKEEKVKKDKEELLKKFLIFIKNVVQAKRTRFFDRVARIELNKRFNFFDEITHPKDQLRFIMTQVVDFLEFYGVNRNHVEMTILGTNSDLVKWEYELVLDRQKQYTDANKIMSNNSLAKKSIDSGESTFLSDLNEGVRQNLFYKSNRSDTVNNIGSIYCKPVTLKIQDKTYKYVFTLVSYGTYLCSPTDRQEANEFATLLDEIGDRVELELYLLAMKQHKK